MSIQVLEKFLEIMNEHTKILIDEVLAPLASDKKVI